MIGQRFFAPINALDYVEGIVTHYNEDSGFVTLITDEGDCFKGYEYQLEPIIDQSFNQRHAKTIGFLFYLRSNVFNPYCPHYQFRVSYKKYALTMTYERFFLYFT